MKLCKELFVQAIHAGFMRLIVIVGVLSIGFLSKGQKQYQNWIFSQVISLDFSTNPPDFKRNNTLSQSAGGAAISDSTGQLLFYGGGDRLYNKEYQLMPNGFGLASGEASSQSMLIVPNPVVDSLYYLFTTAGSGEHPGYRYNVVNITADSGRGDITNKNITLYTPTTEAQAAIRKLGDCGYWVVSHELGNANFRVYRVDEYGVNPAIEEAIAVQEIGLPHVTDANAHMKFSQDGSMIAILNRDSLGVELFDFDLLSGEISNPRFVKVGIEMQSLAFSPLGKTLFVTQRLELHKFDVSGDVTIESFRNPLNHENIESIWDTKYSFKGLYLCPDGLIWLAISEFNHFAHLSDTDNFEDVKYKRLGFHINKSVIVGSMNDFTVGLDWDNSSCNGVHPPRIDSTLYFFTYVTPNGDGFNDVFFIKNIHLYPKSIIRIFNSLGELIFEEEGYSNNWSPSHLDTGTYYYQLEQEGGEVFRDKLTIVN